jgi:glycosyltransferase involved in cell wall biosynthesis
MPKVSVIIPTYNCAHYLGQAIESVIGQTFRDFEIIVLDDGSTDNTSEIADKYGKAIRYIRQTNGGLPAARNRAIEASTGEFVALLDSDDWWEPNKLEEQVPLIEADPEVGISFTDLRVVYDDGTVLPSFLLSRPLASSGYVFDRLLLSGFILPSTVLMRRSCFEQSGRFDESMRSHEDIDLWLRICRKWKAVLVPKPLTHRRQGLSNMTANHDLRTRYDIRLFEKALALPDLTAAQLAAIKKRLGQAHFSRGQFLFANSRMDECRAILRQGLHYKKPSLTALGYYMGSYLPTTLIEHLRNGKRSLRVSE